MPRGTLGSREEVYGRTSAADVYKSVVTAMSNEEEESISSLQASPTRKFVVHSDQQQQQTASSSSSTDSSSVSSLLLIDVREPAAFEAFCVLTSINWPKNEYLVKDRTITQIITARRNHQQVVIIDEEGNSAHGAAAEVASKLIRSGAIPEGYCSILQGGLKKMVADFPLALEGPEAVTLIEQAAKAQAKIDSMKRKPLYTPKVLQEGQTNKGNHSGAGGGSSSSNGSVKASSIKGAVCVSAMAPSKPHGSFGSSSRFVGSGAGK